MTYVNSLDTTWFGRELAIYTPAKPRGIMLKITSTEPVNQMVTLRLDGQLVGPWVSELKKSCKEAMASGSQLYLDFSGVSFVDSDGLAFLRSHLDRHIVLIRPSQFVKEQLKGAGL